MIIEPWIQTISGIKFDLINPTEDMIDINDIAHALSMQCRWNGHCRYFYSLAEHSCHVSHLVPPHLALHGLLHDAAEAFTGDCVTPLKGQLPGFKMIEHKILRLIFDHYGVTNSLANIEAVKFADQTMLATEGHQIVPGENKWLENFPEKANIDLQCWQPSMAKGIFLRRFYEILDMQMGVAV